MKKLFVFAALAMVAIVACNKEIEVVISDANSKADVTIVAQAPDVTKTLVDGLQVKWAAGDHIAVFDEDNGSNDFSLDSGEGTTTGAFSGSFSGKASGGWAVYPYTANAAFNGSVFTVDYASTYAYDAVTVPMYAVEGTGANAGKYEFDNIGGAFKISYTNVPAEAAKFVFTSTSNITGTGTYDMSAFAFTANEGKVVTVTSLPAESALTFVIPVPAGSYSFDVKLLDGSDNTILGSAKTVTSAKDVVAGHILPLKAIKLPAPKGTTLWSENFEAYSDASQPATSSATVYGGGNASYAYNGSYTKTYATGSLGSSELLVAKSSRSETWVVSDIPTGLWDELTLTYRTNQSITITSSDVTVGAATVDGYNCTRTISDAEGLTSFSLTFSMSADSNARLDDILLITGAPVPGITVSTGEASATVSAEGTTATLNGSLALVNGAANGSVTEAGFYYKLTTAGAYTKVTCAAAPTSTTTFSYDLTGLTKGSEYTYYAYAIYDSGSEVTGEATEKTFTPTQSGGGAAPVNKEYSFAFSVIGTEGWSTAYADHTVINDAVATITIKSSGKQTGTITTVPVTKSGDTTVVLKQDGATMSAISFTLTQWGSKVKTVSLQYSTNGGSSYSAFSPEVSSNTFSISSDSLPAGTNAIKLVQGNTSNQVGISSVAFTYTPAE